MKPTKWNRPAPIKTQEEGKAGGPEEHRTVEDVVMETERLLAEQGWCPWRCEALGGDTVIVARDELVPGVPPGYPVYTLPELDELIRLDERTMRMAYELKKSMGVEVAIAGT